LPFPIIFVVFVFLFFAGQMHRREELRELVRQEHDAVERARQQLVDRSRQVKE
jgi:hypothetical protein